MLKNLRRSILGFVLALASLLPLSGPAHAVDDIHDYSTTAGSNTNVGGISIAENMQRASVNNAMREILAQVKRAVANQGSDIASASTTAICATGTSAYAKITGTTTITSFGTAAAGCSRWITFTGALTLTHNATSLILPGAANYTTAAGDVIWAVSEGSGNWRVRIFPASGSPVAINISSTSAGALATLTSTDAGTSIGPALSLYRDSASPADNDALGAIYFQGEDDGGNNTTYAYIVANALDVTNATEDGVVYVRPLVAGSDVAVAQFSNGVVVGSSTEQFKGTGTLNALSGLYVAGHGTVAQQVTTTSTANTTLGTILPYDDTIPQNTEGDQVFSQAVTPVNSSSVIYVDAFVNIGGPSAASMSCALFVDSTANAVAAASVVMPSSTSMMPLTLRYSVSAASTSSRTYALRCGSSSATDGFLNGHASSRIFGGVSVSSMTVTEVLPQ